MILTAMFSCQIWSVLYLKCIFDLDSDRKHTIGVLHIPLCRLRYKVKALTLIHLFIVAYLLPYVAK